MASPTLRSSSSTAPGPILSNCPTSILARPSTAETCTGTSNIASRSAADLPLPSSMPPAEGIWSADAGAAPSASRLGSGTFVSLSLMAQHLSKLVGGFAPRGDKAIDRLSDQRLRRGAVADHAAIRPFDAAIAFGDVGLAQHDEAAFESHMARNLFHFLARGVVNL